MVLIDETWSVSFTAELLTVVNSYTETEDDDSIIEDAQHKLTQTLAGDTLTVLSQLLLHLRPGTSRLYFSRWILQTQRRSLFTAMREYIISHLLCPGTLSHALTDWFSF